jgi:hypothetical protein
MPLVDLTLPVTGAGIPRDVCVFLREANRRIERFQEEFHIPGFVPSDFAMAYRALQTLAAGDVAPGNHFCEWGSGFGVVSCLAAMLDFEARGIEVEGNLVAAAQQLADDFCLPVCFLRGSFIPDGAETSFTPAEEFAWLATNEGSMGDEEGHDPSDFDVIFAYPWPDEERFLSALFERYANAGAVLATYHGAEAVRLRRKIRDRRLG